MDLLYLNNYLPVSGCPGSLLRQGLSPLAEGKGCSAAARGLLPAGASRCGEALGERGFSSRSLCLWPAGLAACWRVGPFQIRDWTRVSWVARRMLYHRAAREAWACLLEVLGVVVTELNWHLSLLLPSFPPFVPAPPSAFSLFSLFPPSQALKFTFPSFYLFFRFLMLSCGAVIHSSSPIKSDASIDMFKEAV